jgi:glutaredoxin-like protein
VFDPVAIEIDEETKEAIREALEDMDKPVEINVYIGPNCKYCSETLKIAKTLEEVAPVRNGTRLIKVNVYEKDKDKSAFEEQGITRIPSLTLMKGAIRYTGTPSGEEIRGLVETIIRISQEDSGLDSSTIEQLKTLTEPVHIEVIVTPQCPYCPYAALLANMFAYEAKRNGNTKFVSEIVEAYENPDIADKYNVMSVPAIAINGVLAFVGVPYEEDFVERIIEIVKKGAKVSVEVLGESATGL